MFAQKVELNPFMENTFSALQWLKFDSIVAFILQRLVWQFFTIRL